MIQAILNFFGLGGKKNTPEVVTQADGRAIRKSSAPVRPPIKKTSINSNNYYRRNGVYYSSIDDGIIEDLMMLAVLDELYADGDINEYEGEINLEDVVAEEAAEDLLDVDVSDTPVVSAEVVDIWKEEEVVAEKPAYVAPEPTPEPEPVRESVSSGSSYSSGSSDSYDSGSDDSGSDD